VARTPADIRDTMIEGESGLIAVSPPHQRPTYNKANRKLSWPNGAFALCFSSYEPDQLRGPQFDEAWCDELGSWKYPRETWNNLQFGLRLGQAPRVTITTTPKPIKLLKEIMREPGTVTTRGATYDNMANLPPSFFAAIIRKYEGTNLGRQEIYAELIEQLEGALWQRAWIDDRRVALGTPEQYNIRRLVVAIDPNVTTSEESDEAGIVAAGIGENSHGYVFRDASGRMSPLDWANRAIDLYLELKADTIVAEANNGGELVEITIGVAARNRGMVVPVQLVHASRGKRTRAEPVAALYQQGKVHHVGEFPDLEDQMCTWENKPGEASPDRLDAVVWGLSELMLEGEPSVRFV